MPTDGPLTEAQAAALRLVLDDPAYAGLSDEDAADALNDSPLVDGAHQPTAFSRVAGLGDAEITVPAARPEGLPEDAPHPTHHVVVGQCLPEFVAQARALPTPHS